MVSGNPCCPHVDPVTNRNNLSISFVYSYEQTSFQNKPPAVFETWFDQVEGQLLYVCVVILFHVSNVALVLRQGLPATSGEAEVPDRCVALSRIDQALQN